VLDNLSRPGVDENLAWLKASHGARVHPFLADIRDVPVIEPAVRDASAVIHLAAQTAVTTSLGQPFEDFEVNARGTLNILEAIRSSGRRIPVLFASTNKVYGDLGELELIEFEDRYLPAEADLARNGVGEEQRLAFGTPYGCSKGVADQYVLDYARTFGIPSAALRMSCIYGPRQFGTEDQGWVAHFLISALKGQPITIFGDGKQVRDILHVADAVEAYRAVLRAIEAVQGTAFNLGGGAANAVSLRMVLRQIGGLAGQEPEIVWCDWRPGDQLYFVADTRRLRDELGWQPEILWREGGWLREARGLGSQRKRLTA